MRNASLVHKIVRHFWPRWINLPRQPRLSYFVLNILDHCNLRCQGCDHFAAIAEKRFVSLKNIAPDLQRMAELTRGDVGRIGVMGGEPLLHPDLLQILQLTRAAFPQTKIELVTNGLLLLQQPEAFWTTCRENRISIVNTKYPLKQNYDGMQKKSALEGVAFKFYGNTEKVTKTSYHCVMDISGNQDPLASFRHCYHANNLPLLMEGKFYPCTIVPNARIFNKKFGTHMELGTDDYLDIYKVKDGGELLDFLTHPVPFCRFCDTAKRTYGHPWARSKQQMSEWTL